jgi:S-adenosylmethionine:tRNA ribosyltransferase-isomerase
MKKLNINDYNYELPNEKIAAYPLPERDQAKLLVYDKGSIHHTVFTALSSHMPSDSFLVFNNTKVISARLKFKKETGAEIEVFLLNPVEPSTVISQAMSATKNCIWQCTIGNSKRWKEASILKMDIGDLTLEATLINKDSGQVLFTWSGNKSFAEIIEQSGATPLPPYLHRAAEPSDKTRYQTIYSKLEGAVAAPTAGLHFTERVFRELQQKQVKHDYVTLHVSAGTFQPIKTENVDEHVMHKEQVIVSEQNILNLLANERIVPVGTTSMRTLESIYWWGVKVLTGISKNFDIKQDDPYTLPQHFSKEEALNAAVEILRATQSDLMVGETAIFIKPGYSFRICKALITNFHQPASTLILLVAAFVGDDWRKIYNEALLNDYRFLSYGDSSLLVPK